MHPEHAEFLREQKLRFIRACRWGLNHWLGGHVRNTTDITRHHPGQREYAIPMYSRVDGKAYQVGWVVVTVNGWLYSDARADATILWKDECKWESVPPAPPDEDASVGAVEVDGR